MPSRYEGTRKDTRAVRVTTAKKAPGKRPKVTVVTKGRGKKKGY